MMLEQRSDVLGMILSTCTHPPVPPIGVVFHEVGVEFDTMRHRID